MLGSRVSLDGLAEWMIGTVSVNFSALRALPHRESRAVSMVSQKFIECWSFPRRRESRGEVLDLLEIRSGMHPSV